MATDGINFDFSVLNSLAADLGTIEERLIPNVRKAVEVTAKNIDLDWEEEAASHLGSGHAKRYPKTVEYVMDLDTDGQVGVTIEPKRGGQGNLAAVLESAPGDVASAPQGNARKALRNNLADFEKGILKATEGLL